MKTRKRNLFVVLFYMISILLSPTIALANNVEAPEELSETVQKSTDDIFEKSHEEESDVDSEESDNEPDDEQPKNKIDESVEEIETVNQSTEETMKEIIEEDTVEPAPEEPANHTDEVTEENEEKSVLSSTFSTLKATPRLEYSEAIPLKYNIQVANTGYSIDTLPWGLPGHKNAGKGSSSDFVGETVQVLNESPNGAYAEIEHNGTYLGWIDKRAFYGNVIHTKNTHIGNGGFSIDSLPWGTEGFKTLARTNQYKAHSVKIVMSDVNNNYYLTVVNGTLSGWIDSKAFSKPSDHQTVTILRGGFSIDSQPWGTPGFKNVGSTINYLGKNVTLTAHSENNAYAFVVVEGKELGWIDKKAFGTPKASTTAMIVRDGFSMDSRPWGEPGFANIGKTGDFYGDSITIIENSSNNAYVFIKTSNGTFGWIDKKALVINPVKKKNYILFSDYSIDNRPWGETGFKSRGIGKTTSYLNKEVNIYAISDNKAYYFVKDASGKPLGWIDYKALGNMNGLKRTIKKTGFSIDSRPWGEPGYTRIGKSSDYLNKVVTILGTSSNGAYSAILVNNKFLGWLDNKAFQVLVYLDPGHGGIPSKGGNPGAVYNGIREQDLNLTISLQVRDRLEKLGYQVVMSREDGNNTYEDRWKADLYARPAHANQLNADILVSVHHNASGVWDSSMNGIETYIYGANPNYLPLPENEGSHNNPQRISESKRLADAIHKDLVSNTGAHDRGVQDGAFIVVREAKMPAVLLELGFMSNKSELNKLTTSSYQQKLVNGIVTGIHNYFLF